MRFLVFSYDDDEQQVFHDLVDATDHNAAKAIVGDVRGDYVNVIEAWTIVEWMKTLEGMKTGAPHATRARRILPHVRRESR